MYCVLIACSILLSFMTNGVNGGAAGTEEVMDSTGDGATIAASEEGEVPVVKSYSQHQQDAIAMQQFFPGKRDGVFVEIGAHDGRDYTNTLLLEELGWTGMLIEANPKVYEMLVVNRPNSINVFGAAYNRDGTIDFRQLDGYTQMLSGIVESVEPQHVQRMQEEMAVMGGSEQIVSVPCFEITSLLERHGLVSIDYMSIDVEGAELQILGSLDFSRVSVKVLQIENNYLYKETFDAILLPQGYTWVGYVELMLHWLLMSHHERLQCLLP